MMLAWLRVLRALRDEVVAAAVAQLSETGSSLARHEVEYLTKTIVNGFLVALGQGSANHFLELVISLAEREARAGNALRVEAALVAVDLLEGALDHGAASAELDSTEPRAVLASGRREFLRTYLRAKADEDGRRATVLESYAKEAEDVPALVYSTDKEGRITAINPRAAEQLGYRQDDLVGQHFSVLMRQEDAERFGFYIQERRTSERAARRVRVKLRNADGTLREFEVSSTGAYSPDGEYVGSEGVARAATDDEVELSYQLDREGNFVEISEATAAALGYRVDELLGRHFSCLMEERERLRVGHMFGERRQDERAANRIRVILSGRQGLRREFEISAAGRYDETGEFQGTAGLGTDLTDRSELELDVTETRQRFRRVFDAIGMGVAIVTPDLLTREANLWHQARRRQPLVGMSCHLAIFGQVGQCDWCGLREAFAEQRVVMRDNVLNPLDGRRYQLVFSPLRDQSGATVAVVETMTDITAEHERRRNLRTADKRAAAARLVTGLSSSLADSLTVLWGLAALLADHHDRQVGLLAQAAAAVVDKLGDLRRLSGTVPSSNGDLNLAVRTALDGRLVSAEDVTIEADLQLNLPAVPLSGTDLAAIVVELVANAVEAMPEGGAITVETLLAEGSVMLRISDTGEGMSEQAALDATDPFHTTREGHDGLGLSLALGLVNGVKGNLRFDSSPGAGTTVEIRLPVADEPTAAAPAPAESLRLVLAEPVDEVRETLALLLEADGHRVHRAETAEELRGLLAREELEVAVVAEGLLGELGDCPLPAVVMSARRRPLGEGQPHELTKPFGPNELRRALAWAVSR